MMCFFLGQPNPTRNEMQDHSLVSRQPYHSVYYPRLFDQAINVYGAPEYTVAKPPRCYDASSRSYSGRHARTVCILLAMGLNDSGLLS